MNRKHQEATRLLAIGDPGLGTWQAKGGDGGEIDIRARAPYLAMPQTPSDDAGQSGRVSWTRLLRLRKDLRNERERSPVTVDDPLSPTGDWPVNTT